MIGRCVASSRTSSWSSWANQKLKRQPVRIYFTVESFVDLMVEVYESFEEVKYRLFRLFGFPNEMLPHIGFYEVTEAPMLLDEAFVEDFVRVSDVLATWALRRQRDVKEGRHEADTHSKIYFRFRYFLNVEDPTSIFRKIEKCFLIADFFRLIYSNKIKVSIETFVRALAILIRMKYVLVGPEDLANLVNDAKRVLKLYGNNSNNAIRVSYKQILAELRSLEAEKPYSLKNYIIDIMKTTDSYRTQLFRVAMTSETIKRHFVPLNVYLMIGPAGITFTDPKLSQIRTNGFESVRQVLLSNDRVSVVFNIQERRHGLQVEQDVTSSSGHSESMDEGDDIVTYITFSFTANQAAVIYQTIQNYISLQMNGLYRTNKIASTRLHVDTDKMDITEEQVRLLAADNRSMYNVNRFFKKEI